MKGKSKGVTVTAHSVVPGAMGKAKQPHAKGQMIQPHTGGSISHKGSAASKVPHAKGPLEKKL
jgi:hypothetical protein